MSRRIGLIAVIPIALIGFALTLHTHPTSIVIGREPARADAGTSGFAGSNSCSSSGCHGGGKPKAPGSEWNTWIDRDPHADAYRVLFNETSRRIATNLNAGVAPGHTVPAHENQTCLKCHAPRSPTGSTHLQADGVSCESCHGAAQRYQSVHYLSFWKGLGASDKESLYGLTQTKSLSVRVGQCASCHIGMAGQEVGHALIAAGHPRLMFEYASSHHHPRYAPHWREKDPSFEVRSWVIGQVASARASLELLAARASRTSPQAWPELAEFNCYSCHLSLSNAPGKPSSPSKNLESIPWGEWSYSLLPVLAEEVPAIEVIAPKVELLEALRNLMNERPGLRSEIAASAGGLVVELDRWLLALEHAPGPMPEGPLMVGVIDQLFAEEGKFTDWDSLAQHYLAVSQLYFARVQSDPASASPMLADQLKELRAQLYYKEGTNSPRTISTDRQRESWQRLRLLVSPPASKP